MSVRSIIVTGAAGFLGSALTVDLSRDSRIAALDRRRPSDAFLEAAPQVKWEQVDIAKAEDASSVFRRVKSEFGGIDFVVHFAAFYHAGSDWHPEYERTNVCGTSSLLQAAKDAGVRRIVFASSIVAMEPPSPGETLNERTPTFDLIPYAKSKSIGEAMIAESAGDVPGVALRIGGAFSDWCELPPLYSLIRLWTSRSPLSRLIPGRGESGFPYIHRDDVVRIVRSCLENHEDLAPFEVLLASQNGAVLHKDLFPPIRRAGERSSSKPIHISPSFAKIGLYLKCALGFVSGKMPDERPWMLTYVDRPWVTDTTYTQKRLGWSCTPGKGILDRIPVILDCFRRDRRAWEERNRLRNEAQYAYSAER
jgi:nucleoside-diphosphate-sugar epimerase